VDLANAHVLADALAEHQRADGRFVRLDVSAVTFLDCTCSRWLAAATCGCSARGARSSSPGVPARIMRLLSLAGLARVLFTTSLSDVDVHPDRVNRAVVAVVGRATDVRPGVTGQHRSGIEGQQPYLQWPARGQFVLREHAGPHDAVPIPFWARSMLT